jgi:hypothetical protein
MMTTCFVGRDQMVHGQVYARQVAPRRDGHVPPGERAAGEQDGVVLRAQRGGGDVHTDVAGRHEPDPFVGQLREPPVDVPLLDFEVGNPVPHEAARTR